MTDGAAGSDARSAGALLRAARERQGLHIAALAAAIKVPQAKLEALEAGRYDELTDATFVRALANSVCRALKIDAKPVLELLPAVPGSLLERVDRGLKAPFRDRPGLQPPSESRLWHRPVFWLVVVLLLAAVGFVMGPQLGSLVGSLPPLPGLDLPKARIAKAPATQPAATVQAPAPAPAPAPTAPVPAGPAVAAAQPAAALPAASGPMVETVDAADTGTNPTTDRQPAGIAVVRASEASWVEARDARGIVLLSRTLAPGEAVGLDGALPLKLVIGNAPATQVTLRGKPVVLGAPNRDHVVRVELK
ncbi:MAG TPA: helix-turn-helix domain-containing protein [Burkholderiaceae bacterium]|nr:helix-turn-helix domain-containing protein [Burkholderiaceae bacterium]